MATQNLTSTDGFVLLDLGDGARHAGPVRLAKKVLQSGAADLARTLTYRYASFGQQVGGACVGINVEAEGRTAALDAFTGEAAAWTGSGQLRLDPGTGVGPADLAALAADDDRWPGRLDLVDGVKVEDAATAAGIVAATDLALGGLEGARLILIGLDAVTVAAARRAMGAGARVVAVATASGASLHPDGLAADLLATAVAAGAGAVGALTDAPVTLEVALGADADAVLVALKPGVIDHENVGVVTARAIVPTGPIPVTARGYAAAGRAGLAVLPDFVTTGGGLVTWTDPAGADIAALATDAVRGALAETMGHEEGPVLGAAYRAEAFLRTWCDSLPFGRPFAA